MDIKGELLQLNKKNKNGRIYPEDVFQKALYEYQNKIDEKRALGELGHPDNFDISFSNVSHMVTSVNFKYPKIPRKLKKKMKKAGKYKMTSVWGNVRLLDTPSGNVAKNIIDKFGKENFSLGLRATGNVDDNGFIRNYKIHTIDLINKNNDETN
jgi:hypothetical protein